MLIRYIAKNNKRAPPGLTVLILGLYVYVHGSARTERCSHVCNLPYVLYIVFCSSTPYRTVKCKLYTTVHLSAKVIAYDVCVYIRTNICKTPPHHLHTEITYTV